MSDARDDSRETLAYRAAMDAFMNAYLDTLKAGTLRRLAGTEHQHRSVAALSGSPDANVVVTVTIAISNVVPKSRVAELYAAQQAKPGKVPTA